MHTKPLCLKSYKPLAQNPVPENACSRRALSCEIRSATFSREHVGWATYAMEVDGFILVFIAWSVRGLSSSKFSSSGSKVCIKFRETRAIALVFLKWLMFVSSRNHMAGCRAQCLGQLLHQQNFHGEGTICRSAGWPERHDGY